jgi:hypothetical protein
VGTHSITAVYGGDANVTGSTSSGLTQTVNAVVAAAPPPTQTILLAGGSVLIQWPTNATGFILKSNADLTTPIGSWGTAGTGSVVGTNYQVLLPVGTGNSFFRLVK